jgi:protein-disulfide isomerase
MTEEHENHLSSDAQEEEERVTITLKRSTIYLGLIPVALLVGLLVGFLIWGRGAPTAASASGDGVSSDLTVPEDVPRYEIALTDSDPVQGPVDAPIVIIEYSDFECPYCRRHNLEVKDALMAAYPGQIRYIHKDFPLASIHPNATSASEAAQCAHEQGKFWDYHDALFTQSLGLGTDAYLAYADEVGLNAQQFSDCFAERRYQDDVQADFDFGAELGIRSTPTFFINGIAVVGAQPFDVFASVIDSELGN